MSVIAVPRRVAGTPPIGDDTAILASSSCPPDMSKTAPLPALKRGLSKQKVSKQSYSEADIEPTFHHADSFYDSIEG